jgi:hypothetical protein
VAKEVSHIIGIGKAGEVFLWALYDHHHLETGATMKSEQWTQPGRGNKLKYTSCSWTIHTETVVIHSVCRPLVQLPASGSLVEEGNCFVFRCSLLFRITNLCRFRQSNWYCLTCIVDNVRDVAYVFCFKLYIGIVLPGKHNVHLNGIGSWRPCIHSHQLFKIRTSFIHLH